VLAVVLVLLLPVTSACYHVRSTCALHNRAETGSEVKGQRVSGSTIMAGWGRVSTLESSLFYGQTWCCDPVLDCRATADRFTVQQL